MDKFTYSDDEDDSMDRLTLNVGGVKFETYTTTLQNIADTRLAWLTENVDPEILRTKEFFFDRHPGAFVHILNFYRTGKLHTPTDICGPAFEEELQFWGIDEKQMEPCCWESFTKHREAEENLRTFEGPGFEDLHTFNRKASIIQDESILFQQQFQKLWKVLDDPYSSKLAKHFSLLSCLMIIVSVSIYCLDTISIIKGSLYLQIVNYICVVFFTVEFIGRVIVNPDKISFMKNYKNWIDFVSIVPSYLIMFFPGTQWLTNLVIIRILRVFKFFKLSYGLQVLIHSLKASSYELTLLLLILSIPVVIFSSLVYAAESGYDGESSKFDSVPRTFWWCIITMTTVGYGDLTPKTWPGQIIGSVCSICGLLIVALPISVIGGNFSLYYAHVRARLKLPKKNRTLLQGNLRGLLRQPLSLSSRDRDRKILRRNNNNAIRRRNESCSPTSVRKLDQRMRIFDQISNYTGDSEAFERSEATSRCTSTDIAEGQSVSNDLETLKEVRPRRTTAFMSQSSSESERSDASEVIPLVCTMSDGELDTKQLSNNKDTSHYNKTEQETGQKVSQTIFSPKAKPKIPRNVPECKSSINSLKSIISINTNPTPRSERRGALRLAAQKSSDSGSESDETDNNIHFLPPEQCDQTNNSSSPNDKNDYHSNVAEQKRRVSMQMLDALNHPMTNNKPLTRTRSHNPSLMNGDNGSDSSLFELDYKSNKEKTNLAPLKTNSGNKKKFHLFLDTSISLPGNNYRLLARSKTERKPKSPKELNDTGNTYRIKSEGDIQNLVRNLQQDEEFFANRSLLKESGV